MDSLIVNKALAAVLLAGIAFQGARLVSESLVHPEKLEHTAVKIEGVAEQPGAAPAPVEQDPPVAALLASADPAKGEADTKKLCVACHTFNEGGHAGVGPNLYGVVGLPHGHMEGFSYSAAIKGKTGPWTFDELYEWLKSPRTYAPGTKMSFAGIENPKERADVIAFLNKNSASPEALPTAPPPAPPAGTPVTAPKPEAKPAAPTNGQQSQPSENQNMPGAAAAGSQQPPNATSHVAPGGQGGQPQPSPDAHKP